MIHNFCYIVQIHGLTSDRVLHVIACTPHHEVFIALHEVFIALHEVFIALHEVFIALADMAGAYFLVKGLDLSGSSFRN
jgi:asparagine synthetase B (glutamine-hydrolysing)